MCGRYTLTNPDEEEIKRRFDLKKRLPKLSPRFNISPQQEVPVILNESPNEISLLRWGLIPHWAKEEKIGYKMINARAETILEKLSYKGPFRKHRCLVLADSFYEWKKTKEGKKPFRVMMKDDRIFCFAGIWASWKGPDKEISSFSIITVAPNQLMKSIHDRMPVIIPPEGEKKWLAELSDQEAVKFLKAYPAEQMKAYEISTLVNSPKNDSSDVIVPA